MERKYRVLVMVAAGLIPVLMAMASQQPGNSDQPIVGSPQAKVTNPHGPLTIPCQNCHTYTSWKPIRAHPEFNHDQTGYPLRGMHQKVDCVECHTSLIFKNISTHCADCHADIHRRQFGSNCESCHSVKGWQISLSAIRNHQNRFPLVGAHALLECDDCHKNAAAGQFAGLSTACYSCHQQDFQTPVINHIAAGFPSTCESCHTMDSWFNAKFDHLKYTGYALTGTHATLPCTSCHINNVFAGTPSDCYSCHVTDFTGTNNPPHVQLGLPHDCGTCHSTTDWLNAKFDHTLYAHYPLTGVHATLACTQCHVANNYLSTPTACYGCHQADFTGTTNPNHVSAGFPTDCSICHTTSGWTPSSFDHSTGAFPLTGAHLTVPCAQCHVNNNYATVPTDCYSCHRTDYTGATNPNHVTAGFPTTCTTCHNTSSWTNATFNHNNTAFPLTGAHVTVPCAQCHVNNNYTTLPTACYGCHQADFTGTTDPAHVAAGFPTDCTLCHSTATWSGSTFNHNTTAFPLTGAHTTVACAQCHVNNNYMTLPTACYGCHQSDWTGTTNPNHAAVAFPTTCDTCHDTTAWTTVNFNHAVYANYPLTGVHATLACAQCHVNNNYASTSTACYSCHQADFTGATSPNHVASGFPTDCSICHTTSGWAPSSFNHATVFPLTGAHAALNCTQCHANNNYTTLPTACYGCHQTDWNGTTDPNHAAAGFPTTCDTCHTTTDWTGATFNHNNTPFPLTGAHTTVDCIKCHVNNVFAGTPTACYSCHQADYTGTTNPNHASANWPTTCTTCHTTTAWLPATLPASYHTFFPLNHGNANGVCTTCHTNSSDYSVFTCTSCHTAAATNGDHRGVSGYVYNSVNCYACHKNGGG